MTGRQRLRVGDVEPGTAEVAAVDRRQESVMIDQRAA